MDVCRVCLRTKPDKDLSELNSIDGSKSYTDVLYFCLDIQVSANYSVSNKLCKKCYKKIISFHEFKSLALKNDAYLRSLVCEGGLDRDVLGTIDINEVRVKEEKELKSEFVKLETEDTTEYQSEDEILSVIKKIKYGAAREMPSDSGLINVKRKRGRPKGVKIQKGKEICAECGEEVKNLKEHLRKHMPLADRKSIKCKECDKLFSSYGARYKHYKLKHLGIKPYCDICNKYVASLKAHVLQRHKTEDLPCPCMLCDRRFLCQSALEEHMTVHTKDRPHECDSCGKKFRTKALLMSHIRQVHQLEKSHLCQFCSKSFFKKYHLQVHIRIHTKEKPYKCRECDKSFSSTTVLKSHLMTHSNVKRYECPYCESSFVKPGYLKTHLICHTKEKRHACKYCGIKFGRSDHRKRHEFTAHEKHLLANGVA